MHTFNGSRSKKPLPKSTIQLVPDNMFRITALIMRGSQLSNFGWSFPGPWLRARLRRSSCSAKHFYLQLKRRNIPAWTFILRDGDDKSHSTVSISVCQAAQSRLNHNYIFFSPQAEEKGTNLGKSTISGRHDSLLLNKTVTHTQDLKIKVFSAVVTRVSLARWQTEGGCCVLVSSGLHRCRQGGLLIKKINNQLLGLCPCWAVGFFLRAPL